MGLTASGLSPPRVAIGAVKSVYGHTEGAAGITGVLMAAAALRHAAAAPVANLGALNPHVASALEGWRNGGGAASAVLPRQCAPAADGPLRRSLSAAGAARNPF